VGVGGVAGGGGGRGDPIGRGGGAMAVWAGIDVAKEVRWATAVSDAGEVLLDRRVPNRPAALEALAAELAALGDDPTVGVDVVGGVAGLLQAVLAEAGVRAVHVPGLAVNRARRGTAGGESKSDPRDARVIADQGRTRRARRAPAAQTELDVGIRLPVGRRRDLVHEQTRRLSRLHDPLGGIFPGREGALDPTTKGGLWLLTADATPAGVRAAGRGALPAHLRG